MKADEPYKDAAMQAMGRAIAEFRKGLLEGGLPEELADDLTRQYLGDIAWHSLGQKREDKA